MKNISFILGLIAASFVTNSIAIDSIDFSDENMIQINGEYVNVSEIKADLQDFINYATKGKMHKSIKIAKRNVGVPDCEPAGGTTCIGAHPQYLQFVRDYWKYTLIAGNPTTCCTSGTDTCELNPTQGIGVKRNEALKLASDLKRRISAIESQNNWQSALAVTETESVKFGDLERYTQITDNRKLNRSWRTSSLVNAIQQGAHDNGLILNHNAECTYSHSQDSNSFGDDIENVKKASFDNSLVERVTYHKVTDKNSAPLFVIEYYHLDRHMQDIYQINIKINANF